MKKLLVLSILTLYSCASHLPKDDDEKAKTKKRVELTDYRSSR